MTVAVVIGAYRLTGFVTLCLLRWRRIIPDVPILISDDKSDESKEIKTIAEKFDCDYCCSDSRRGHFASDMQTFINGLVFGRELGVDIVIKCSQRVIAVLPALLDPMFQAFFDPACQIVMPGQIQRAQIARPGARFYSKFGILTDLVAMRVGCIDPEEILNAYRNRASTPGRKPSDLFVETSWGWLLEHKFPGSKHKLLAEWTHHEQGKPKLYLRKSQSTASDYAQVAKMEGIENFNAELREWVQVEGKQGYKPCGDVL